MGERGDREEPVTAVEAPAAVTRPSQERYQTLITERNKTAQHLAECEFLAVLESTPAGDTGYRNLLEFRYPRGKSQFAAVPRGVRLAQQIEGTRAVLALIDDELKAWNEAEEAWLNNGESAPADGETEAGE